MRNVVLIGLPGCGKSTIGAYAAKDAGKAFVDLDEYIERTAGMTIPQLFEQRGESGFRDLETAACRAFAEAEDTVIACGGGVVLRPENMEALSKNGTVVFIDRPAEAIVRGINTSNRPLLSQGADRVFRLAAERDPLYRRYADVILPNTGRRNEAVRALTRLLDRPPLRLAVIGDPIDHSLSPAIHLPTLRRLCPEVSYEKIRVERGGLPAFLREAKGRLDGFNLTMPHKADILPLLDETSPLATAIGAVNTVRIQNGRLSGTSTDGGFYDALIASGVDLQGKKITLIGTGGAADTLAVCGASHGIAHLSVAGRNREKARRLLEKATAAAPALSTRLFGLEQLNEAVAETDILINATPLGMAGVAAQWEDLSFLSRLPDDALVCDLIYKPDKTLFLQQAEQQGHSIRNGLDMLIWQAVLADEFYLNLPLNRARIARLVREQLELTERKS